MTRSRKLGLVVLGLLSVVDLAGPLATDGEHPPMSIALVGSALGLASLVLIGYAWRGATRAITPLVVLRVVSMLTALPAFFVDDVPGGVRALVVVLVVLTAVGVAGVLAPQRSEVAVR